ncbi:MAG: DapH/DapD/GlmU-related protein [Methanocellales archaeon]|nr:DapH/DapD/GlmU-related protein [Methanocellales archaeon]
MTKIGNNVVIGKNPKIGEYVEIGVEPVGLEKATIIGDDVIIRSHSVIYSGNRIGNNFQTGHGILLRENNLIGDNVSIGSHTVVERDNRIGNNVRIHSNCFIPEFVKIEDDVWIGPSVVILNVPHPPCPRFEDCAKSVVIKRNAKIGGNVTIGPRVIIGKNSLIGMGSLVTKNIPDNSVAYGHPAKAVKKIDELTCDLNYFKVPYEWEANRGKNKS